LQYDPSPNAEGSENTGLEIAEGDEEREARTKGGNTDRWHLQQRVIGFSMTYFRSHCYSIVCSLAETTVGWQPVLTWMCQASRVFRGPFKAISSIPLPCPQIFTQMNRQKENARRFHCLAKVGLKSQLRVFKANRKLNHAILYGPGDKILSQNMPVKLDQQKSDPALPARRDMPRQRVSSSSADAHGVSSSSPARRPGCAHGRRPAAPSSVIQHWVVRKRKEPVHLSRRQCGIIQLQMREVS